MKTLLLILLFALPILAQPDIRYDKFRDQTLVATDRVRAGSASLYMAVKAISKGQTLTDPHIYLVFYSASSSWRFLRSHSLIFLADGERIDMGEGTHDGTVGRQATVSETMIFTIERDQLEKLAKSTSLEFKLGFMEGKLEDSDKKGMREMLSLTRK